ncbi:MAG: glycosyltransferase family 4 protein [Deltaproteobacteria bacterium]|nr:glycosyltransferase family 4 protein [Deltaproteobacteria bacterium]
MSTPEVSAAREAVRRGRILFLCPYPPGTAASQRFRFEQYMPALREHGFEVDEVGFLDEDTWRLLYKPGHTADKVRGVLAGFRRRLLLLRKARHYDYVFIHLEAAPIGPPLIELALLALKRKIIYDIDDAIFVAKTSKENRLASMLRWRSKVAFLARRAYKVTAVNPFLVDWARQFRGDVILLPTTIDPSYHRPPTVRVASPRPILGWTGTKSTAPFLDLVRPVLVRLQDEVDFEFRIIADADPGLADLRHCRFVKWSQETEIADLQTFDVGLMPVPDTLFSKGKVGFKAIQYSAVGIPSVVSDVGSGREVVEDGRTGYVVPNTEEAWYRALRCLLRNTELRQQMGSAAREFILRRYSIPAQTPNYVGLFT